MKELQVEWSEARPDWLATIDFGQASLGCRNEALQIRLVELPALEWTLFLVLAPMEHGLSCLDVYAPFGNALRLVYFASDHVRSDEPRRRSFDRVLRSLGIERKSSTAYHCFGIYPGLWGHRYFAPSVRSAGRLLSIAVPSRSAESTQRHLERQIAAFGSRCVSPAHEDEILFWHGDNLLRENVEVLLETPARLGAEGRARVVARLTELIDSAPARQVFLAGLDGALRRGWLVNTSTHPACLAPGDEKTCEAIWRLRLVLCAQLGFFAALDYARRLADPDEMGVRVATLADELLEPFPVVDENPLT